MWNLIRKRSNRNCTSLFSCLFHAHVYTHASVFLRSMQAYHCRFLKAWNKRYICVKRHFLLTFFKSTPTSGQAEKGCSWHFGSEKNHVMIQLSLPRRCKPICGLVAVWIRTVATATPTLWDWKCVFWISSQCDLKLRLERWRNVYFMCL